MAALDSQAESKKKKKIRSDMYKGDVSMVQGFCDGDRGKDGIFRVLQGASHHATDTCSSDGPCARVPESEQR